MGFALQFSLDEVEALAARYNAENSDAEREGKIETTIAPCVRDRGHYEQPEFLELCRWKTPRTRKRCESNDSSFVVEATSTSLRAANERLRIGALTLLDGVSWPTASVLLHFGHMDPYPILDFRALEALGVDVPSVYTFDFWWEYMQACRTIADSAGVPMRRLDRSLWQWSKNQARSG
jgi:hypothetical protein